MRPLFALLLLTLPLAGRAEAPKAAVPPAPAVSACARKVLTAKDAVLALSKAPLSGRSARPWTDLAAACAECAPSLTTQATRAKLICEAVKAVEAEGVAGASKAGLRGSADDCSPQCGAWVSALERRVGVQTECEPQCN